MKALKYMVKAALGINYPKHRKNTIAADNNAMMTMTAYMTSMGQIG